MLQSEIFFFFKMANFERKSADLLVGMVNFNSSKQLVYKTEYFLMKLINIDGIKTYGSNCPNFLNLLFV